MEEGDGFGGVTDERLITKDVAGGTLTLPGVESRAKRRFGTLKQLWVQF